MLDSAELMELREACYHADFGGSFLAISEVDPSSIMSPDFMNPNDAAGRVSKKKSIVITESMEL